MKKYVYLFDDLYLTNDDYNHIICKKVYRAKKKTWDFLAIGYHTTIRSLRLSLLEKVAIRNLVKLSDEDALRVKELIENLEKVEEVILKTKEN